MTYNFTSGRKLVIEPDNDPQSPRDNDNYATMIFFHKRYRLGDKHNINPQDYDGWDEMQTHLEQDYKYLQPVYMLDHSGITISLSPFSGQIAHWDSGRIGFIGIKRDKQHQFREKRSLEIINTEIEIYDQYIRGDIYYFELLDKDDEQLDSCAGFYGDNPLTNGMTDYLTESEIKEL